MIGSTDPRAQPQQCFLCLKGAETLPDLQEERGKGLSRASCKWWHQRERHCLQALEEASCLEVDNSKQ